MASISAAVPSIGDTLAQLISGSFDRTPTATAGTNSTSSSTTPSTGDNATVVALSDQAKAAVRAQSDQAAADRLQAFVEARRVKNKGTGTTGTDSLQNILDAATQSADAQPAEPTTGAKVQAIVAQIKAAANANAPQPFQPFTPTKSLSNSITFNGFTLTLSTNASTQYYGVELSGNGVQAYNKHFGPSDGAGGSTALPPGIGISMGMADSNNEAEDFVTITQNLATASSTSISSSSGGSVSTSSVNAQSSSITFLVNYATGQISVAQSAASVSERSTSIVAPGSSLSTLA